METSDLQPEEDSPHYLERVDIRGEGAGFLTDIVSGENVGHGEGPDEEDHEDSGANSPFGRFGRVGGAFRWSREAALAES